MMARVLFGLVLTTAWIVAAAGVPAAAAQQVRPGPPQSRPDPGCLHDENNETAPEKARREQALGAVRLIYYVLGRSISSRQVFLPTWEALAASPVIAELQNTPGPRAELARQIKWGAEEPLPGWGISYVTSRVDVRYALTDLRDPCAFTYSSIDPAVIPRTVRIVPLESDIEEAPHGGLDR